MLYEKVRAYRASLIIFIASVVLGGLAIAFITTPMVSLATSLQVNMFGISLLIIGVALLVASGYLYVKSQNIPLAEKTNWDTEIKFRIDGSVERNLQPSFDDSRWIAIFAYSSLLRSQPNLQPKGIFGISDDLFPFPESSMSFHHPLGDRMGAR